MVQPMDEVISATDANREFSRILGKVREGHSYVVTSHGKAIARIAPLDEQDAKSMAAARATLLTRLRAQPALKAGRWTREELYEDGL
jgi:prevent-host-death family protein